MSQTPFLTTSQLARLFDVPSWRIRRIVDALDTDIPRIGGYRMITRKLLGKIATELEQLNAPADTRAVAAG